LKAREVKRKGNMVITCLGKGKREGDSCRERKEERRCLEKKKICINEFG
jgi:hypothetical protein